MQKYNCKTCGAELYWDPQSNSLKCDYCDSHFQPTDFEDATTKEDVTPVETLDVGEMGSVENKNDDMVIYACSNCGAEVVTSKTTMATNCAYCGRAISITDKAAGAFRPDLVLPFEVNRKKAKELYKKYLKSSILVPAKFSENATIEKMQGLYVPFWLHSMHTHVDGVVKGENSESRRRGDDKIITRKIYHVHLDMDADFIDLPTDASKELDDSLMDSLEPFNYQKLSEFNPAYMAGFFAEQPDEQANETIDRAKNRIKTGIEQKLKEEAGYYDIKSVVSNNNEYSNVSAKYAMLPVWLLTVEWNNKKYIYAINGQSGKVVGTLPMNGWKLAFITGGAMLVTNLVLSGIGLLSFLL